MRPRPRGKSGFKIDLEEIMLNGSGWTKYNRDFVVSRSLNRYLKEVRLRLSHLWSDG